MRDAHLRFVLSSLSAATWRADGRQLQGQPFSHAFCRLSLSPWFSSITQRESLIVFHKTYTRFTPTTATTFFWCPSEICSLPSPQLSRSVRQRELCFEHCGQTQSNRAENCPTRVSLLDTLAGRKRQSTRIDDTIVDAPGPSCLFD